MGCLVPIIIIIIIIITLIGVSLINRHIAKVIDIVDSVSKDNYL